MASFVHSTVETASGFSLSAFEYGYITETGVIAVTGAAVSSSADFVDVLNDGALFGTNYAVQINGQGAYISNAGIMRAGSNVIQLEKNGDRVAYDVIYNTGIIEGTSPGADGIVVYMGGVRITNSGTITTSGDDGIQINANQGNGSQTNEIVNSGLISTTGSGQATYISDGSDDLTLTNTGEIVGGIYLAGGDDVIEGANGLISGDILAGYGNDVIKSGIGDDVVYGGYGDDTIRAGEGDDFLEGGNGRDQLFGGAGNDTATYENSSAGVRVNLNANRGWGGEARGDRLYDIENLVGSSHDDILVGNALINQLEGGEGADQMNAGAGNDTLLGQGGDDTLIADEGADILNGGLGRDILWGGDGEDIFEFLDVAESGIGSSRDVIKDWEEGIDLIDLAAMGATSFSDSGFTNTAGEVAYELIGGGNKTVIEYDHDGDGAADFKILINNGGFTMTESDFVLG